MPEQLSMDDILKDKPEVVKDPVEKQQEVRNEEKADASKEYTSTRKKHQAKEYEAQGRDPDTGQFVQKEEPKAEVKEVPKEEVKAEVKVEPKPAAVQQELTDKERGFLKGLEEERRKRQGLERDIAEMKAKQTAPPAEAAKGFWDDPEGTLKKHRDEMANMATNTRLQTAELIARSAHPDFDEKIAVFEEILQQTPGVYAQWIASPNPAEFAYKMGKNHKELRDAGDIDTLRANIEKETRIKLEAELKAKAERLEKERAAIPPSLSDVRGAASTANRPVWTGPPSLEEILKR